MKQALLGTVAALGALLAFAAPASASLIQRPNLMIPGRGGNSNIILSLQNPGNSSLEAGSVTLAGCTGNTIGPCPGVANTLWTFFSAGISSAAALTLFLDAVEPGSDNFITLIGLTLNVYGAGTNNSRVFSAPFVAGVLPLNLIPSPSHGNNPVNTFVLDDMEAAQLQAPFAPGLRVGLSASFTNAPNAPVASYPQWARRSQLVVLHA
jgi:hypothetical protein